MSSDNDDWNSRPHLAGHWKLGEPWYRRIPRPTLHGIGWAVNLAVGLVTLWLVAHGGRM